MRDRRDPWKWPLAWGATISLLCCVVFVVPRSWFDFLLAPQTTRYRDELEPPRDVLRLLPPLAIEVVPPRSAARHLPEPPVPTEDPRWWTRGWAVAAAQDEALFRRPKAAADTVSVVLATLGLGADFMTRARPDSVLAARLFKLSLEDNLRYDELKPFLTQMARSEIYADILARAADMYDEPLAQEIRVPD